jgi:hypothetical protein
MSDRAELIADMMEQIQAATPDDELLAVLSELIGAAAAMMEREIGRDDTVSTLARLCITINEGTMPAAPLRN